MSKFRWSIHFATGRQMPFWFHAKTFQLGGYVNRRNWFFGLPGFGIRISKEW